MPTPAQHFVERHQVLDLRGLRLDHRLLGGEQRTLRVEHVQVAGGPIAVAQIGEWMETVPEAPELEAGAEKKKK